ncbi:MAG: FAD-dependent oxidoreductase [Clostridia bacterium]|nr:FAD-dependent oxidoreductase [Clostridia bacterium]
MNSMWTETSKRPTFPALQTSIKTDVLIIGGGMAGILCAYLLKNAGIDCVLAEAKQICDGVTKNTTAKITFQHGLLYHQLINRFGKEKASLYYAVQKESCERLVSLCKNMDCDLERKDSFVYSLSDPQKIQNEVNALRTLGEDAAFCRETELLFPVAGAVQVKNQARFHPLKFVFGIAKELPIYEHTKILQLQPGKATTHHGEIRFKTAIVATHFPILNKHGAYFLKLYQHRSYALALEGAESPRGMYVDEKDTGLSFRTYQNLLLLGGGGHRTGKQGGNWKELEQFARRYYPGAKIVTRWATQDCVSLDGVPYIGRYGKNTQGLYVATGFNKWGMSSSMVSAMILTDLVQGKENKYASVFNPARSIFTPQLLCNAWESLLGILTPTVPRCPHLGCALKYNPQEHSWDCPCHGSRFDEHGALLNNPATDDKRM